MRGVRQVGKRGARHGQGEGHRCRLAGGAREETRETAGDLADGAGRRRGPDHRRPGAPSGARRHHHRWRQLLLHRRHPPGQGAGPQGGSLCGRRHQRGRLGPRARLLHDDRRRGRCRSASSTRSSRPWRRAAATSRARRDARRQAEPPSRATCIAGRAAPDTSSRWCTTGSSTG